MSNTPWPAGTATGIGSLPGTDPLEAARVVVGELPALPHLPELPARGVGADVIGRTAGVLVDLAVEVIPSGYRVTAKPGVDHRRAVDLLRRDLDAFDEALQAAGARPTVVKAQLAGPWTLTAGIELVRGHRVLTDHGALREFSESLAEGLAAHVRELAARTGAQVVVQFDEPTLPAVLAGSLPTPSGYGTVRAVEESTAVTVLERLVTAARDATGQPVVVHCCAPRPPLRLLRRAGADALALDVSLLWGASAETWDELGEVWDAGAVLFLGLLPGVAPERAPSPREAARPALELVDRLGFARSWLAERAVVTPSCGLAGATPEWARRALTLVRDLGRAFVEPPESW
ncbi:Cobalamin-independent synthase, Catalytic domain [Streptoalloteichus tenebrarius]|uniref:Cobalamin-independent synthase, Catalytic domain n=1 Tax=Streptoalloteichus tenebrarius (strain ATCC 17920 / DSM 40477 / JCM 4838 / CBS 697.72 / NBRC 16177 / NCIMB 11028 / NRRL B-12390 / A12253. 1 / ISP 5477) TaxID=1933 RepID=A0ABT1HWP7_STRSD|nr:methionine synthase [Streptoalloteichus tenebrarius]MCP2259929.1 Cobalamin-independent synthase, Catalytic domain [Streptoalloteichus tenebrarius]BFF03253.1 methionine synthase [Streptoalloteichus tenebrarius]